MGDGVSAVLPSRRLRRVLLAWVIIESMYVALLGWKLPTHYRADHWDLAWVGLDSFQVGALMGALWCVRVRSSLVTVFTSVAATLFLVDAWFDVTTAYRGAFALSVVEALLEVPFAMWLFWWAVRFARAPQSPTP